MKNETIDQVAEVLTIASDMHPEDFNNLISSLIVLMLEDWPESEAQVKYDIIISELNNDYDRADLVRTYCHEALNMAYDDWSPIYKALGFAARYEFNKGRVTFGKSDLLAMLANAIMDMDAPMTGRVHRGANDRPLPTNAAAVAYLESL